MSLGGGAALGQDDEFGQVQTSDRLDVGERTAP